jgi:hypothetical protein
MNNIFSTNQLILKIIDQYDVKHIMKLPIKTTMSNLKDLTTLSYDTNDNVVKPVS